MTVTLVAFAEDSVTPVPDVGDAGGVIPTARRTMIWDRSASVGLVQDSAMVTMASASCGALDISSLGSKSTSCTATDNAGNTQTAYLLALVI